MLAKSDMSYENIKIKRCEHIQTALPLFFVEVNSLDCHFTWSPDNEIALRPSRNCNLSKNLIEVIMSLFQVHLSICE